MGEISAVILRLWCEGYAMNCKQCWYVICIFALGGKGLLYSNVVLEEVVLWVLFLWDSKNKVKQIDWISKRPWNKFLLCIFVTIIWKMISLEIYDLIIFFYSRRVGNWGIYVDLASLAYRVSLKMMLNWSYFHFYQSRTWIYVWNTLMLPSNILPQYIRTLSLPYCIKMH